MNLEIKYINLGTNIDKSSSPVGILNTDSRMSMRRTASKNAAVSAGHNCKRPHETKMFYNKQEDPILFYAMNGAIVNLCNDVTGHKLEQ